MKLPLFPATIILILLLASCAEKKDRTFRSGQQSGSSGVSYAERFTLEKTDSCTILTIRNPWQGAEGVNLVYYLAERGKTCRLRVDSSSVINVPIHRIICMSSTHLAMIAALNEGSSVCGVSGTNYIYDPVIRARSAEGLISETGYDAGINTELILNLSPDLIMMYGIGSESAGYVGKVSELGTRIMYNADYLETHPLGKAEWIKVFGALYCREKMADSIFSAIEKSYSSVREMVKDNTSERPSVLLGMPFRDTWFISPGNSYISTLISDAGGKYLWNDTRSAFSMPYSFETVYLKSLQADFWLNPGAVRTKREISAFDQRLVKMPCFISGEIYNNTLRMSDGGGNDYWESGTLNPHLILKDIASILHPGIFGDYELHYYLKIE